MKRLIPIIAACLFILTLSGCGSNIEKVNVIKGPGQAKNSYLVSINQVRAGTVEGFLGKSSDVLLSQPDPRGLQLFKVNADSGKSSLLATLPPAHSYNTVVSPDGSRFLFNDYMVNTDNSQTTLLPGLIDESSPYSPLSYNFSEDGELVFTDPVYYVEKYFGKGGSNGKNLKNLSGVKLPDINPFTIMHTLYGLHTDSPKLVFLGQKAAEGNNVLYQFDFLKREFLLIDENVSTYSISPDYSHIAYIKKSGKNSGPDKLMVADLKEAAGKELASMGTIAGLCWSGGGGWIAFSGGEANKYDLWVVRSDGSAKTQLTNGLHATNRLSWSRTGNKIAFTSYQADSPDDMRASALQTYNYGVRITNTFIITVNITEQPIETKKPSVVKKSSGIGEQLLSIIRKETRIKLERKQK